jgi:hypothetical protein
MMTLHAGSHVAIHQALHPHTNMRTPAGKECRYFYGDYYRGRRSEQCRLLEVSRERWTADLCRTCPVPDVLRANACEFLRLYGTVARPISALLQRRVQISAYCEKVGKDVSEPQIGCGECHPLPPEFVVKP